MNLEKFAKEVELAEKRASIQLGHVALNDVKTLDGLLKRANSALGAMRKAGVKSDRLMDIDDDTSKIWESGINKVKEEEKTVTAVQDNARNLVKNAENSLEKARQASADAKKAYDDARTKWLAANSIWGQEMKAGEQIADNLAQQIKNFLQAAKALGVDGKGLVGKYQAAAQSVFEYNRKNFTNRDI
jgi:hypothetical protein